MSFPNSAPLFCMALSPRLDRQVVRLPLPPRTPHTLCTSRDSVRIRVRDTATRPRNVAERQSRSSCRSGSQGQADIALSRVLICET